MGVMTVRFGGSFIKIGVGVALISALTLAALNSASGQEPPWPTPPPARLLPPTFGAPTSEITYVSASAFVITIPENSYSYHESGRSN